MTKISEKNNLKGGMVYFGSWSEEVQSTVLVSALRGSVVRQNFMVAEMRGGGPSSPSSGQEVECEERQGAS